MKKSTKIIIGLSIVLAFVIGFFAGTQFNFAKPEKSDLAGTMGKTRNIEKFKVLEDDPELLNKLLSETDLLKIHQKFFTYQLNTCSKLNDDLGFALQASESEPLFAEQHPAVIEKIKTYRQTLVQSKASIELALSTLSDLSEIDQETLANILKQANTASEAISYKNESVVLFIDSVESFLLKSNPYLFNDLIKAHDLLSVNNFIPSI